MTEIRNHPGPYSPIQLHIVQMGLGSEHFQRPAAATIESELIYGEPGYEQDYAWLLQRFQILNMRYHELLVIAERLAMTARKDGDA